MEPVACQDLPENPAPPEKDPDPATQPPTCVSKTRRGAVQSKPSALYLKLLSLRVGLLGWLFCLKKIQWDVMRWVHISLELATDVFFSWVQNALLASMMLLLLIWKLHTGAKQHGWKTLLRSLTAEAQYAWGPSLLRSCCHHLKCLVKRAAWAPACFLTWILWHLVRALEVVFMQALRMAGDDKVEEAIEEALPESVSALILQREEQDPKGSQ
ncbi:uncharacterized protein LOC143824520 [Paroedura picta]|uniref:uncharacterized protein LOC143824520 n=1 Tax=Paroedura picta TaxID=143630 RepID=UPI0040560738